MSIQPSPHDVLWACVDDGFHVGSRAGQFLGYIDRQSDGMFAAFSMRSEPVGLFPDLHSAMAVLTNEKVDVA